MTSLFLFFLVCCILPVHSWQHDRGVPASNVGARRTKIAPPLYDTNHVLHAVQRSSKSIVYEEYDSYEKASAFVKVEDGQFRLGRQILFPAGRHVALSTIGNETSIYRFIRTFASEGHSVIRLLLTQRHGESSANLLTDAGENSDWVWRRLDYFLVVAASSNLHVIMVFADNTPDIGGAQFFEKRALGRKSHEKGIQTLGDRLLDLSQFFTNEKVLDLYKSYLRLFITRTNTLSSVKYKDDPAIFSWELGRNLFISTSSGGGDGSLLRDWIRKMAAYIKSLDSNHLVASGENGFMLNSTGDYMFWNQSHMGAHFASNLEYADVDYATVNISPDVWNLELSWDRAAALLRSRSEIAKALGKPLVLEYGSSNGRFLRLVQESAKASGYSGFVVDWAILSESPTPYLHDHGPKRVVREHIFWAAAGGYNCAIVDEDRWKEGIDAAPAVENEPTCSCSDDPPVGDHPCSYYEERDLCDTIRVKGHCQLTCGACPCSPQSESVYEGEAEEQQLSACTCTDEPPDSFVSCEWIEALDGCDVPAMENFCQVTCGSCSCGSAPPQSELEG